MALPTNVRVEAVGITTTRLRWTDTVAVATVDVQRSPDDITYASIATVAHGVELYVDETVDPDTKYWYKLSQDAGVSFTTPVSVWTHVCESEAGPTPNLPRAQKEGRRKRKSHREEDFKFFKKDNYDPKEIGIGRRDRGQTVEIDDVVDVVNEISERVEGNITRQVYHGTESIDPAQQCDACVTDGKIILDCNLGCEAFVVTVDEDINSISVINCPTCPSVDFLIPPGADVGICGWPERCYYDPNGDDCFDSRIEGGDSGGTGHTDGTGGGRFACKKPKPNPSCLCPFDVDDILKVICCTTGNSTYPDCNLNCDETIVVLQACGGCGPYTWEIVSGPGSVKPKKSHKVVVTADFPDLMSSTEVAYIQIGIRTQEIPVTGAECDPETNCVTQTINPGSIWLNCAQNETSGACLVTPGCLDCGGPHVFVGTRTDTECDGSPYSTATLFGSRLCTQSGTGHYVGTLTDTDCFSIAIEGDISTVEGGATELFDIIALPGADCTACNDTEDIVVRVTDKVGTTVTVIM